MIKDRKKAKTRRLCKELQQYQKAGLMLLLDGQPSSPKKIARCTFREDKCYMRDYIRDDSDQLKGIGFDSIPPETPFST